MEGAIVGYDANVTTGGIGLGYIGWTLGAQYHKDQVTVNIRATDINSGTILHSVTTTKTIYSTQIQPGLYKFISYKDLVQSDDGYTYNEPVQLAVQEAIEEAVINMIVEGIYNHSWVLANADDISNPLITRVHEEQSRYIPGYIVDKKRITAARKPGSSAEAGLAGAPTQNAAVPDSERVQDIPLRAASVVLKTATTSSGAAAADPKADPPATSPASTGAATAAPVAAAPPSVGAKASRPIPTPTPDSARQQAEQMEKARQGRDSPATTVPAAKSFLSPGGE
jgi:curli production assembly/transport component CsgG